MYINILTNDLYLLVGVGHEKKYIICGLTYEQYTYLYNMI